MNKLKILRVFAIGIVLSMMMVATLSNFKSALALGEDGYLHVNPVHVYPEGGSFSVCPEAMIQYFHGTEGFNYIKSLIGDWSYYISPTVSITVNSNVTISAYNDYHEVLSVNSRLETTVTAYIYGWEYDPESAFIFLASPSITSNNSLYTLELTAILSGVLTFSSTRSLYVYIYPSAPPTTSQTFIVKTTNNAPIQNALVICNNFNQTTLTSGYTNTNGQTTVQVLINQTILWSASDQYYHTITGVIMGGGAGADPQTAILDPSGSWEICERTHWKESLMDTIGFAEWDNMTLANFTGYYATFRFSELTTGGTGFWWWENYAQTLVSVWLNFTGSTETRVVLDLEFKKRIDLWGAVGGLSVASKVRENPDGYYGLESGAGGYGADDLSFAGYTEVYVYKDGENLTVKVYNYLSLMENPKLLTVFNLNVTEAWFNDVSFRLAVRHMGFHPYKFEGYLENENFDYSMSGFPSERTLPENIWNVFVRGLINTVEIIPQYIRNMANQLSSWLEWLMSISIGLIWNFASMFIQFLPLILIFWGIDVAITSVETGSITPIGNMVFTIYNFLFGLMGTIVGIIQTIYDFIHFW